MEDLVPNIQEIIKQIQRDLSCPVCGGKFQAKDIKVRGAFDHMFIVQAMCGEGHLTLLMTIFKKQEKIPFKSITSDEALDLDNCINNFNGDFEKLWKK